MGAAYVSDEDPEYEPCEHKAEAEESPEHSEEEDEKITKEEIEVIKEEAKTPKEVAAIIPNDESEEAEEVPKEVAAIIPNDESEVAEEVPKEVAAIIPNDESKVADEVKLISDAVSAHMKSLAENLDEDAIALVEEATAEEGSSIVRTEETTMVPIADKIKDVEDEDISTSDLEEE